MSEPFTITPGPGHQLEIQVKEDRNNNTTQYSTIITKDGQNYTVKLCVSSDTDPTTAEAILRAQAAQVTDVAIKLGLGKPGRTGILFSEGRALARDTVPDVDTDAHDVRIQKGGYREINLTEELVEQDDEDSIALLGQIRDISRCFELVIKKREPTKAEEETEGRKPEETAIPAPVKVDHLPKKQGRLAKFKDKLAEVKDKVTARRTKEEQVEMSESEKAKMQREQVEMID